MSSVKACACGWEPNYEYIVFDDGVIAMDSCCGGGCVAACEVKFCAGCGKKLEVM